MGIKHFISHSFAIISMFIVILMPMNILSADNNTSPLCFTARNGSVNVRFSLKTTAYTIQYSTDGTDWNTYTSNTIVTINANQSIYFRAETDWPINRYAQQSYGSSRFIDCSRFYFTSADGGKVEGSGNIMSLYGPSCPDVYLFAYAFRGMFFNCSLLTTAPELTATKLGYYCYDNMFGDCTSLTTPPELPATTLSGACYGSMFSGCTSLTAAPELPATTLAEWCYSSMFSGCTSLTVAPELPATTLAEWCYSSMFSGCTSLTAAPELPATTLADFCYQSMFAGCTSLTTAPELPGTTLAEWCYKSMFSGCMSLTSSPILPATILEGYCYRSMFAGCSSIITPPTLPATTLAEWCYESMFSGCTSLTTPPELPATTLAVACYSGMFSGCTSLTSTPELPHITYAPASCYKSMFSGCMSITTPPELPADSLGAGCYYGMFQDCISLISAPELPATNLAEGCYTNMFFDCYSLTLPPELPATSLAKECYFQMFDGCVSLTKAPELPATTLADHCYTNMFGVCESLTTIPELPAATLAFYSCANMFSDCTSLVVNTEGPGAEWTIPATTTESGALLRMFLGTSGTMNGTPSENTTYYIASDPSAKPLCFTAKRDSVTVRFDIKNITHTIQYSTDGINWNIYTPNASITINANQSVYFCAETNQTFAAPFGNANGYAYCSRFYFSCSDSATVEGSGNIMSLYGPNSPDLPLQPYAFNYMFYDCTSLTTVPSLNATTLSSHCYDAMFSGCTSLTVNTAGPGIEWTIPATSIASDAMNNMFLGTNGVMNGTPFDNTTYYIAPVYKVVANVNDSTMGSATGSGLYTYGTLVRLIARPNDNYHFVSWDSYDDLSTTIFTVRDDVTLTAIFDMDYHPEYSVTAKANDRSMGKVYGGGDYDYGETAYLTASPNEHYHFVRWSNGDTSATINFNVTNDTAFIGYFEIDKHIITVVPNSDDYGEVTGGGEYEYGTVIKMTATPYEGYKFKSWSIHDLTEDTIYHCVVMNDTITAIFVPISSSLDEIEKSEYVVYSNEKHIFVEGALGLPISIYDMNGTLISEVRKASDIQEFLVNFEGVYIVFVDNKKSIKVKVK